MIKIKLGDGKMKELVKIFENEDLGKIRVVILDGEPWFVGKDVSEILGYVNPSSMYKLIDESDKMNIDPQSTEFIGSFQNGVILEPNTNIRKLTVINESGLYDSIFGSTLESAKTFKKWVTSVLLPTIRKTGGFVANEDLFINTYLPFADDLTKQMFGGILATVRNQNETIAKQRDENIKLINKTETQHKLIDTMTESYDGTYIRMVSHDYINKACKQTNQSQSELYNKVYKLVGRSLKIDLDVQLKNFSNKERQIVKSNMEYNRENNLKGMDRKTPCFIKDSKAEISKLEFICNVLGRGIVVLESIAKVCEVGISEVVSKYNIIKETAKIKGDDYNV